MKNLLFLGLCFIVSITKIDAQIFTNNIISTQGSWNASISKTIAVSGLAGTLQSGSLVLKQVNIHLGSQSDATLNFSRYTISLTSPGPSGTSITLVGGNPMAITSFPSALNREFNTKFRDNSYLRFPSSGSGTLAEPWHIGYYRTYTANDFSSFNGKDPNGNWTLTINENSTDTGVRFNKVELVFGSPFTITDKTTVTAYNDCSSPQCIESSSITIATNNGFTSQSSDMYNGNTTGCSWNAAQNNSAWFSFKAAQTSVNLTLSGISNNIQILAVNAGADNNPCTPGDNSVLSGGCPELAINDTYISQRYSNGSIDNNQLNLSGLTIGNIYYLLVDGNGGAISPYYIEIDGAIDCCTRFLAPNTQPADTQTKVGIGTHSQKKSGFPENIPSGLIAFDSKTKGLVIPRVSNANRPVGVAGLLIYNTDENCIQFHNGSGWKCIEPACVN